MHLKQEAKYILNCIKRNVTSRWTELIVPLFSTLMRYHLVEEKALGDLIAAFLYLKGAYKKEGADFLLVLIVIGRGGMALN